MKFPSLKAVTTGFISTSNRFPFELLIALVGTITSFALIETEYDNTETRLWLQRVLWVTILALPITFSFTLFIETHSLSTGKALLLRFLIVIILMGVYLLFAPIEYSISMVRFGLLLVAFHLFTAFAPFINRSDRGFWEYNKQIFLRILTALLYSSVLYIGLFIAIFSTDELFNLDLDSNIYLKLWVVIVALFNTTFFLAGVPDDWANIGQNEPYPRGLKIFTQYVLIPLATIYLGILLAYELKILLQWSLPKGWVSWLVIGYSIYGILSVLLIHPIRNEADNRWIKIFSRWFYMLLFPLILLLAIAIWVRIDQYGITEKRYILIVLAFWLAAMVIYFLSKGQNIKVIPISLSILALASTWGPQSATSIAIYSQSQQLINYFRKHNAYKDGKLVALHDSVRVPKNIYDIPEFFSSSYPLAYYSDLFSINKDSLKSRNKSKSFNRYSDGYQIAQLIRNKLALKKIEIERANSYFYGQVDVDSIDVEGYKILLEVSNNYYKNPSFKYEKNSATLILSLNEQSFEFDLIPAFREFVEQKNKWNHTTLTNKLILNSKKGDAIFFVKSLSFSIDSDKYELDNWHGFLLLK